MKALIYWMAAFVLLTQFQVFGASNDDLDQLRKIVALQMAKISHLENNMKGMIGQFGESCPSGWLPADGQNGRLDLRGVFLRGVNDFGSGPRTDEYAEKALRRPGEIQEESLLSHSHSMNASGIHSHSVAQEGNHKHPLGEAGTHQHTVQGSPYTHMAHGGVNALGLWKSDSSIQTSSAGNHSHSVGDAGNHSHALGEGGDHTHTINSTGGLETRPTNMGVIFCIHS